METLHSDNNQINLLTHAADEAHHDGLIIDDEINPLSAPMDTSGIDGVIADAKNEAARLRAQARTKTANTGSNAAEVLGMGVDPDAMDSAVIAGLGEQAPVGPEADHPTDTVHNVGQAAVGNTLPPPPPLPSRVI